MAVVKKNTYVAGSNQDITNAVLNIDLNRLGMDHVNVVWSGSAFLVKAGSIIEANGSLYLVESSDINLGTGTGNVVFDSSTLTFSISASAATYDPAKAGWYAGATVRVTKNYVTGSTVYHSTERLGDGRAWNGGVLSNPTINGTMYGDFTRSGTITGGTLASPTISGTMSGDFTRSGTTTGGRIIDPTIGSGSSVIRAFSSSAGASGADLYNYLNGLFSFPKPPGPGSGTTVNKFGATGYIIKSGLYEPIYYITVQHSISSMGIWSISIIPNDNFDLQLTGGSSATWPTSFNPIAYTFAMIFVK